MSPIEGAWRAIRRYDLLPAGTRVVAAVSGGADSVALLHLLLELAGRGRFVVAGIAHVNHRLRGPASDADESFCRSVATGCGLPIHVERVDVRALAAEGRRSLEDTARHVRYEALGRAREALGGDRIAVGHTRDDQAETVLLKLLRGAGSRGLAGIYPVNGRVVRPLIDLGREQVRAWLADKGIAHVEDATNEDLADPRNLVRHRVLPALAAWFGPSVPEVLARTAEIARADEAWLADLVAAEAPRLVSAVPGGLRIAAVAADAPVALQRRLLLQALREAGARHPGLAEVETLRSMLAGRRGGADLPGGVRADRNGAGVVLSGTGAAQREPPAFCYALPVPGSVWVPEARATLRAEGVAGEAPHEAGPTAGPAVVVPAERVRAGLFVRSWRPGDALRPVGLGGRKKLQDLFVDRKVARRERHRLPLVVDALDRVVWVPGIALDEAYIGHVSRRRRGSLGAYASVGRPQ